MIDFKKLLQKDLFNKKRDEIQCNREMVGLEVEPEVAIEGQLVNIAEKRFLKRIKTSQKFIKAVRLQKSGVGSAVSSNRVNSL